jgi:molecular chaperone GrpE
MEQPQGRNMSEPSEKNEENSSTPEAANDRGGQETEVAALKAELATMKDRLLRAAADADNARKRAQRDVEETSKYANTAMAKDLVSVAENLYRALESIPAERRNESPALQAVAAGVDMTLKELLATFEKHGIRRINPLGEPFDHNFHQAVLQVETPDQAPGTVAQVLQAGYVIHDRLLRPAMVGVVKQPDTSNKVDTTA